MYLYHTPCHGLSTVVAVQQYQSYASKTDNFENGVREGPARCILQNGHTPITHGEEHTSLIEGAWYTHHSVLHGLSTLSTKVVSAVDALVVHTAAPDLGVAHLALWTL